MPNLEEKELNAKSKQAAVASTIFYWTKRLIWKAVFISAHTILSIWYWKVGKKITISTNPLLNKSAKELAAEIREGKITSEAVITAFIDRIEEVDPYLNAVVEERYEDALKEAKQVDAIIKSGIFTTEQLEADKPLLGIPFTVKVLLNVKGMRNTAGSKLYTENIAAEDAPSVALMQNAGAIVLATTNSPEFGLSIETNNLVHGKTRNPYDTNRTPGGSSGGESALIGAGASIIGLGNDIAGSLRIPSHFTGIFSHKATAGFIPNNGMFVDLNEEASRYLYTGPMCRYSEDLIIATRILSAGNIESQALNREIKFENLKISYMMDCGNATSLPVDEDIIKAIEKAISHFKDTYGAKVKEVKISNMKYSNFIHLHCMMDAVPNATKTMTSGRVEDFNLFWELFKFFIGKSTFSLSSMIFMSLHKFPFLFKKRNVLYCRQMLAKINEEFEELLDENSVFFYPTFPTSAPYHWETLFMVLSICYTNIFNLLGLPVTNCPVGFNRKGLPQGMQIVARKNNDALTIACAHELSKIFNRRL